MMQAEETRLVRLARSKAWAKANRDRVREINAAYHKKHREKRIAACKAWAKGNPDKRKRLDEAARAGNREKLRERSKAWAAANPEKAAAIHRNKRARKRAAEGAHTAADAKRIRSQQKDRCAYCSVKLSGKGHLDHIQPLARGGSNWPRNLQYLCGPCNTRKQAKDPVEFAQSLGRLI